MSDSEKNNNFPSLVVGIIIGAAITYLFTNKKGQKIKDHLLKEGKRLLEDVADIASEMEENVAKKLEEEKEEIEEKVKEVTEEVPKHIEQIQKKGRRFFFRRSHTNPES